MPPPEQPRFSCTTLSQTNSKERAWGAFHTQKNSEILHPTAALPKLEEMRLPGVTGEVAGLWENSGSFGEVVNRFLRLCLSMCDTRPGWNCSLVIKLGLAYPKILESMKGGSGETRSHYHLFSLMIICVAWSSQSGIARRFGFPGWVGAGLEGRRSAWAASSGLAPHAFLSQADTGVVPGWKSLAPGWDPRRASLLYSPPHSLHALSQQAQWRRGALGSRMHLLPP